MSDETDNVTTLHPVPKPTVSEEVKADVVMLLQKVLTEAQAGRVDCVFMAISHPDGTFSEAISKTLRFREMVGQIEVSKQNWIGKYLSSLQGRPLG